MTAPDSRDSVERVVAEMRSYRMLGEFPLAEAQDWADRLQALARGPQQAGGEDAKDAARWRWFIREAVNVDEDLNLAIFLSDKETADHLIDAALNGGQDDA